MNAPDGAPAWREDRSVRLADGRRLAWAEYGAAAGEPVFYFHGFPGSRCEGRLAHAAAYSVGVRLIAIDRPGCGQSDDRPGRTLLDWASDVVELAHALALNRYAILGVSGGGPYALACAHALGEELSGVAVVAGLGPHDELDAVAEMNFVARAGFALGRHAPRALRWIYGELVGGYVRRHPDAALTLLGAHSVAADSAVIARPDVRSAIRASVQEALRAGSAGVVSDLILYSRPWGFALGDIRTEVHVWHGELDRTVPVAFGRAFARRLPQCSARFLPGEGHFSLPVLYMDEILRPLHAGLRRRRVA